MGPKEARKGGPGPPGDPKMEVRGGLRAKIVITFGT